MNPPPFRECIVPCIEALAVALLTAAVTFGVVTLLGAGVMVLVAIGGVGLWLMRRRRDVGRRRVAKVERDHARIVEALRDLSGRPPPSDWQERVWERIGEGRDSGTREGAAL